MYTSMYTCTTLCQSKYYLYYTNTMYNNTLQLVFQPSHVPLESIHSTITLSKRSIIYQLTIDCRIDTATLSRQTVRHVLWLELDKKKHTKRAVIKIGQNTTFKLKFYICPQQKGEGEWGKNEGGAFHPEEFAGEAF